MQKTISRRWRPRNPFGDRVFYKAFITTAVPFAVPTAGRVQNTQFGFGDMAAISAQFGSAPGLSEFRQLFSRYRVRGIKLSMTYYYVPVVGSPPVFIYANAAHAASSLVPVSGVNAISYATLPEQRWAKSRICQNAGNGGRPTRLSVYYSVNKVEGPDNIVKNDLDYTADTDIPPNPWQGPLQTPWLQFGVCSLNGNAFPATADTVSTMKVGVTVYLQGWQRRTDFD